MAYQNRLPVIARILQEARDSDFIPIQDLKNFDSLVDEVIKRFNALQADDGSNDSISQKIKEIEFHLVDALIYDNDGQIIGFNVGEDGEPVEGEESLNKLLNMLYDEFNLIVAAMGGDPNIDNWKYELERYYTAAINVFKDKINSLFTNSANIQCMESKYADKDNFSLIDAPKMDSNSVLRLNPDTTSYLRNINVEVSNDGKEIVVGDIISPVEDSIAFNMKLQNGKFFFDLNVVIDHDKLYIKHENIITDQVKELLKRINLKFYKYTYDNKTRYCLTVSSNYPGIYSFEFEGVFVAGYDFSSSNFELINHNRYYGYTLVTREYPAYNTTYYTKSSQPLDPNDPESDVIDVFIPVENITNFEEGVDYYEKAVKFYFIDEYEIIRNNDNTLQEKQMFNIIQNFKYQTKLGMTNIDIEDTESTGINSEIPKDDYIRSNPKYWLDESFEPFKYRKNKIVPRKEKTFAYGSTVFDKIQLQPGQVVSTNEYNSGIVDKLYTNETEDTTKRSLMMSEDKIYRDFEIENAVSFENSIKTPTIEGAGNNIIFNNIFKSRNGRLFALHNEHISDAKLRYSDDNGNTWKLANLNNSLLHIAENDDGMLLGYSVNEGAYYSTNNGLDWTKLNINDEPDTFIRMIMCANNTFCVFFIDAMYKSVDCITWKRIEYPTNHAVFKDILSAYCVSDSGKLIVSSYVNLYSQINQTKNQPYLLTLNDDDTFSIFSADIVNHNHNVTISNEIDGTIVATISDQDGVKIYYTRDEGKSWVKSPDLSNLGLLLISTANNSGWYTYRTSDSSVGILDAKTMKYTPKYYIKSNTSNIRAFHMVKNQYPFIIYKYLTGYMFVTTYDNGETWKEIYVTNTSEFSDLDVIDCRMLGGGNSFDYSDPRMFFRNGLRYSDFFISTTDSVETTIVESNSDVDIRYVSSDIYKYDIQQHPEIMDNLLSIRIGETNYSEMIIEKINSELKYLNSFSIRLYRDPINTALLHILVFPDSTTETNFTDGKHFFQSFVVNIAPHDSGIAPSVFSYSNIYNFKETTTLIDHTWLNIVANKDIVVALSETNLYYSFDGDNFHKVNKCEIDVSDHTYGEWKLQVSQQNVFYLNNERYIYRSISGNTWELIGDSEDHKILNVTTFYIDQNFIITETPDKGRLNIFQLPDNVFRNIPTETITDYNNAKISVTKNGISSICNGIVYNGSGYLVAFAHNNISDGSFNRNSLYALPSSSGILTGVNYFSGVDSSYGKFIGMEAWHDAYDPVVVYEKAILTVKTTSASVTNKTPSGYTNFNRIYNCTDKYSTSANDAPYVNLWIMGETTEGVKTRLVYHGKGNWPSQDSSSPQIVNDINHSWGIVVYGGDYQNKYFTALQTITDNEITYNLTDVTAYLQDSFMGEDMEFPNNIYFDYYESNVKCTYLQANDTSHDSTQRFLFIDRVTGCIFKTNNMLDVNSWTPANYQYKQIVSNITKIEPDLDYGDYTNGYNHNIRLMENYKRIQGNVTKKLLHTNEGVYINSNIDDDDSYVPFIDNEHGSCKFEICDVKLKNVHSKESKYLNTTKVGFSDSTCGYFGNNLNVTNLNAEYSGYKTRIIEMDDITVTLKNNTLKIGTASVHFGEDITYHEIYNLNGIIYLFFTDNSINKMCVSKLAPKNNGFNTLDDIDYSKIYEADTIDYLGVIDDDFIISAYSEDKPNVGVMFDPINKTFVEYNIVDSNKILSFNELYTFGNNIYIINGTGSNPNIVGESKGIWKLHKTIDGSIVVTGYWKGELLYNFDFITEIQSRMGIFTKHIPVIHMNYDGIDYLAFIFSGFSMDSVDMCDLRILLLDISSDYVEEISDDPRSTEIREIFLTENTKIFDEIANDAILVDPEYSLVVEDDDVSPIYNPKPVYAREYIKFNKPFTVDTNTSFSFNRPFESTDVFMLLADTETYDNRKNFQNKPIAFYHKSFKTIKALDLKLKFIEGNDEKIIDFTHDDESYRFDGIFHANIAVNATQAKAFLIVKINPPKNDFAGALNNYYIFEADVSDLMDAEDEVIFTKSSVAEFTGDTTNTTDNLQSLREYFLNSTLNSYRLSPDSFANFKFYNKYVSWSGFNSNYLDNCMFGEDVLFKEKISIGPKDIFIKSLVRDNIGSYVCFDINTKDTMIVYTPVRYKESLMGDVNDGEKYALVPTYASQTGFHEVYKNASGDIVIGETPLPTCPVNDSTETTYYTNFAYPSPTPGINKQLSNVKDIYKNSICDKGLYGYDSYLGCVRLDLGETAIKDVFASNNDKDTNCGKPTSIGFFRNIEINGGLYMSIGKNIIKLLGDTNPERIGVYDSISGIFISRTGYKINALRALIPQGEIYEMINIPVGYTEVRLEDERFFRKLAQVTVSDSTTTPHNFYITDMKDFDDGTYCMIDADNHLCMGKYNGVDFINNGYDIVKNVNFLENIRLFRLADNYSGCTTVHSQPDPTLNTELFNIRANNSNDVYTIPQYPVRKTDSPKIAPASANLLNTDNLKFEDDKYYCICSHNENKSGLYRVFGTSPYYEQITTVSKAPSRNFSQYGFGRLWKKVNDQDFKNVAQTFYKQGVPVNQYVKAMGYISFNNLPVLISGLKIVGKDEDSPNNIIFYMDKNYRLPNLRNTLPTADNEDAYSQIITTLKTIFDYKDTDEKFVSTYKDFLTKGIVSCIDLDTKLPLNGPRSITKCNLNIVYDNINKNLSVVDETDTNIDVNSE